MIGIVNSLSGLAKSYIDTKTAVKITEAEIHLVTIDKKGKPVKIPETLKVELEKLI